MTPTEVDAALRMVLASAAPGAPVDALASDAPLRATLDLDSLDFLRFVIGLHQTFGVQVPEADYPRIETLHDCATYLAGVCPACASATRRQIPLVPPPARRPGR